MSAEEVDELLNPYSGQVRPEKHDPEEQGDPPRGHVLILTPIPFFI